jgi:hypothetical protein
MEHMKGSGSKKYDDYEVRDAMHTMLRAGALSPNLCNFCTSSALGRAKRR